MRHPYPPEYDYDDEEFETEFEVSGIDDCDHLYSGSFEYEDCSDCYSVYLCVDLNEDDGKYYATAIVDGGHFVDSFDQNEGPFDTPEDALRGCSGAFDCLYENAEGQPIEFSANFWAALKNENKGK
jgi:hypothetical protein